MLTKNDKEYIKKGCHDLSNIISLISGNYQLLEITEPSLKNNSRFRQLGDNIRMLIDAMAAISFYRYSDQINPVIINTTSFIDEVIENVKLRSHTSMLDITLNSDGTIPDIKADKVKIPFVIYSLMDNIADCQSAGSVSVNLTYDDLFVEISVSDELPDFDPEILSHIYEPFNSFKSDHIGLSLASSQNIMKAHGGELIRTANENGSTFTLRLPIAG